LTTGVAVAASGSKKVTEFDYWLSQFVGLVPREEYRLVINDSVTGGMCCGYGDGPAALYTTVDARTRRVGRSRVSRPVMLLRRPASTKRPNLVI
jgi:hypothetical protein